MKSFFLSILLLFSFHLCFAQCDFPFFYGITESSGSGCTNTASRLDVRSNPGKGWQYAGSPNTFDALPCADDCGFASNGVPSQTAYERFKIDDLIELPKMGESFIYRIDISPIVDWVNKVEAAGMTASFRVMFYSKLNDYNSKMRDLGMAGFPAIKYNSANQVDNHFWMPDFLDTDVQGFHDQLLEKLGDAFDGHPSVDFIDIGSIGLEGEWHHAGVRACISGICSSPAIGDPITSHPSFVNFREAETSGMYGVDAASFINPILTHYVSHFSETPLLAHMSGHLDWSQLRLDELIDNILPTLADPPPIGLRGDGWGQSGNISEGILFNSLTTNEFARLIYEGIMDDPKYADLWKTAPIVFETGRSVMGHWIEVENQEGGPGYIDDLMDWADAYHVSMLHHKGDRVPGYHCDDSWSTYFSAFPTVGSDYPAAVLRSEAALTRITQWGYDFEITKGVKEYWKLKYTSFWPFNAKLRNFTYSFNYENIGTAPIYKDYDWAVRIVPDFLFDPNNDSNGAILRSSSSVKNISKEDGIQTVTINGDFDLASVPFFRRIFYQKGNSFRVMLGLVKEDCHQARIHFKDVDGNITEDSRWFQIGVAISR